DHSAKNIVIQIVKYTIGGPAFGFVCGLISVFLLNRINNELEVEITLTFGISYLVFYVADAELGVSAVLALVVMGLYMAKHKYCISSNVQLPLASVWQISIYFINILIFTVTGLIVAESFIGTASHIEAKDFGYSLLLYLVIHLGRILTIIVLYPLIKWSGVNLNWKECIILIWSGLRGSMALILVLIIYLDSRIDIITRDRFLFHVSMIVLLTLVINGTSSKFLVHLLGLHKGTKESQAILIQALEHMKLATSKQLIRMKDDVKFKDVDWNLLQQYLPEKLLEELDEEQDTDIHRQLTQTVSTNNDQQETSQNINFQTSFTPSIYQINLSTDLNTNENKSSNNRQVGSNLTHKQGSTSVRRLSVMPIVNTVVRDQQESKHCKNIRDEMIIRLLTAMSIDYEKQWYLGMLRRKTLDILIKSVEQAKQKCSLELHWKLITEKFKMSIFLQYLLKLDQFSIINKFTSKQIFEHLTLITELTLGKLN
ncbi:unnamed protein product, partial [Didymodactylos carnosus]